MPKREANLPDPPKIPVRPYTRRGTKNTITLEYLLSLLAWEQEYGVWLQ